MRELIDEEIIALWKDRSDGPANAEILSFARAILQALAAGEAEPVASDPPPLPSPRGFVDSDGDFHGDAILRGSTNLFAADQMNDRWREGWLAGAKHGMWASQPVAAAPIEATVEESLASEPT